MPNPPETRRPFAEMSRRRFTAIMSGLLSGGAATISANAAATSASAQALHGHVFADAAIADPNLRDAAYRGLALALEARDPVHRRAAQASLERLMRTDAEAAALVQLYRIYDTHAAPLSRSRKDA